MPSALLRHRGTHPVTPNGPTKKTDEKERRLWKIINSALSHVDQETHARNCLSAGVRRYTSPTEKFGDGIYQFQPPKVIPIESWQGENAISTMQGLRARLLMPQSEILPLIQDEEAKQTYQEIIRHFGLFWEDHYAQVERWGELGQATEVQCTVLDHVKIMLKIWQNIIQACPQLKDNPELMRKIELGIVFHDGGEVGLRQDEVTGNRTDGQETAEENREQRQFAHIIHEQRAHLHKILPTVFWAEKNPPFLQKALEAYEGFEDRWTQNEDGKMTEYDIAGLVVRVVDKIAPMAEYLFKDEEVIHYLVRRDTGAVMEDIERNTFGKYHYALGQIGEVEDQESLVGISKAIHQYVRRFHMQPLKKAFANAAPTGQKGKWNGFFNEEMRQAA